MKKSLVLLTACLLAGPARSGVRVFVQDTNGAAVIKYECTAGEIVRSFALDVRVDKGRIVGISDFFRGESKMGDQGYRISPPPFAITSRSAPGNSNWNVSDYTPLAVVADSPGGTLPGLNSNGVTLDSAGFRCTAAGDLLQAATRHYVAGVGGSRPGFRGRECQSRRSGFGHSRSQPHAGVRRPLVDPSVMITGIQLVGGVITISFKGGELETAHH